MAGEGPNTIDTVTSGLGGDAAPPPIAPVQSGAASSPAPAAPPNFGGHAKLVTLISHGLQGLGALGTAIATHGREGGVQQVMQEQNEEKQQQRADQELGMRQKAMNLQAALTSFQLEKARQNADPEHQEVLDRAANAHADLIKKFFPNAHFVADDGDPAHGMHVKQSVDALGHPITEIAVGHINGHGTYWAPTSDEVATQEAIDLANSSYGEVIKAAGLKTPDGQLMKANFVKGMTLNDLNLRAASIDKAAAEVKGARAIQKETSDAAESASKATIEGAKAGVAGQTAQLGVQEGQEKIKLAKSEEAKNYAAAAKDKAAAKATDDTAFFAAPDLTGTTIPAPLGGAKEYNKRLDSFIKSREYTNLQSARGSKNQFDDITTDMEKGNFTGADSIVGLFAAIGMSVTPMQGKGMRINKDVISEHIDARGLDQTLYQKLLRLKQGDIITPKQLRDYAGVADSVMYHTYVNAINDAHSQNLKADFLLPTGNNQPLSDPTIARIFLSAANGDPAKARAAAQAKGWTLAGSQ